MSDGRETERADAGQCERCGNPVTERESVWVQDRGGRLRLTTISELGAPALATAHIWHAGCLHAGLAG
jgi:hypothetical protein